MKNKHFHHLFLVTTLLLWEGMHASNAATHPSDFKQIWNTDSLPVEPDSYVAFRGEVTLGRSSNTKLLISGASWYEIWIDGTLFGQGPDRYAPQYPEYQIHELFLTKGNHLIAIKVHYEGVSTRILKNIDPFLMCKLLDGNNEQPIEWKCKPLEGYWGQTRRINPQLGWMEWLDTRKTEIGWEQPSYNDSAWSKPKEVKRELGTFSASKIGKTGETEITPKTIATGEYYEQYGYERDNPSVRLFLRRQQAHKQPAQGIWRRYDLGKVRLMRPRFVLDLPEGTTVDFVYSEELLNGRASPWITLSGGESNNFDHFVARGGKQEFMPMTPKGGRYVEIQISAPTTKVEFINEKFLERGYFSDNTGTFQCNDSQLDKLWMAGVETLKSCAEDALIDNPTRERGQWLGDIGLVGAEINAVAFNDLRLIRRGLVQCAQCADSNGFVAGLCPGGEGYLSSYSVQWVSACMNYYRSSGDRSLLEELFDAACANMKAFQPYVTDDGVVGSPHWNFIDWGFTTDPEKTKMALTLHLYKAVDDLSSWAQTLGKEDMVTLIERNRNTLSWAINGWLNTKYNDFASIGYHCTVLAFRYGFIPDEKKQTAINYIKDYILSCYPNVPVAERLSDPGQTLPQSFYTPYFAYYAFPILFENGEARFATEQFRRAWVPYLDAGMTTLPEVFDTRWSHCHQWSGSPTWLLSRYVLGLTPQFNKAPNQFIMTFSPGDLRTAQGTIPYKNKSIKVSWEKRGRAIEYIIEPPESINIYIPASLKANHSGLISVKDRLRLLIQTD